MSLDRYPSRATSSLRARTRSQRRWPLSVAVVPTSLRRAAPAAPHPPRAPPATLALITCSSSLFATATAMPLASSLRTTMPLGSHATTSLPFARRPSHPTQLAIPTAPNVARSLLLSSCLPSLLVSDFTHRAHRCARW
ncbi:hypothetical protein B0H11DRAFT_2283962 [Mycena galericulata]|nr:hypothetical protein B0H11DRAFT_2283962 [Mycena galericulata]